jgi:RNA polymerase sigma factor for flagellar operon FliA
MAAIRLRGRLSGRHNARHAEPSNLPTRFDNRPMEELWVEYKNAPSEDLRNFLVEKYLHLVRYNAERIYTRLPDEVDIEDLMSVGLFGLVDAINGFDLEKKVKFETYCAPRIRGAILDELRSMDWVPRLVRQRTARFDQTRQRIEMESGHRATEGEIAERLNLQGEEYDKYRRDASAVSVTSITRKAFHSDSGRGDTRELDVVRDDAQTNPLQEAQRRDLKDLLTKGLSRAERLIVILYYYEGMTMKEIGATLNLSESRVSQMHSSILMRLKAQMQHRMRELEPLD